MNQIFSGKTAVYVSCPYSKELSCKKSEKSNERLPRTFGQTDGLIGLWAQLQLKLRTNK